MKFYARSRAMKNKANDTALREKNIYAAGLWSFAFL